MSEQATSSQVSEHHARWKWFLALGVVLLVLGLAGVSVATLLELTSLLVFGPMLLASSIVQLLTALFGEKGKERLLHFAAAGVEMVFGFLIMVNPPERVVGLIALVAIFLVVVGLVRLVRSLLTRSRGRVWTLLAGAIALLLGISVWMGGSVAKLGFVGLCIALDFLCHGIAWSALALAERKPDQSPVS
jgi:uncharacterized membrane protein HdeD (DUF308 family)